MMDLLGLQVHTALFWTIVGVVLTAIGVIVALVRRRRLPIEDQERQRSIEEQVRLANESMEELKKKVGKLEVYLDGLPKSEPSVFDPFLEGTKLMNQYKWDEAVSAFQKSMKQAKASQLVALYNLVAVCYYTSGRMEPALQNFQQSATLAQQFDDKEGRANALGNIGLIYRAKGDLDQALKYHQDALETDRDIGYKQGEAQDLIAVGLVLAAKGRLNEALTYYESAVKIHRSIGFKEGEATALGNIGLIYEDKVIWIRLSSITRMLCRFTGR